MNIVNIVHIGAQTYHMDHLPKEAQLEIGRRLNQQALEAIGYKLCEQKKESNA